MKLDDLLNITSQEMTKGSKKKRFVRGAGVIIGAISSKVFLKPNQRLVARDSKAYQGLIIGSSMGINVIVNGYFNVIAADEFFDLWDPVTGKLLIPISHLGGIIFFSVASAACFAFLDLDSMYINFGLQVFTYTTQHFFAIKDAYDTIIPQKPPKDLNESDFRNDQKTLVKKIDQSIEELYQHFDRGGSVSQFLNEDNEIGLEAIESWISQQKTKTVVEKPTGKCRQGSYYGSQMVGAGVTVIGNFGFHSVAVNGFKELYFLDLSDQASWGLASFCMIFVYGLALIVTKRTIDQVCAIIQEGITSNNIPYFIRKNLIISLTLGLPLTIMAIFSFGSSMRLTQEAIYPIEASNPPNFQGLDGDQRKAEDFYSYITAIVNIIFNLFPVGPVVETSVKNIKYYFGSTVEKQQVQVIDFFKALRNRVVKATVETVSVDPSSTAINSDSKPPSGFMQTCGQRFWSLWGYPRPDPFNDADEPFFLSP
jgi:hypothetical protein